MRACDRCKSKMDIKRPSNIADEEFDLCKKCCKHISDHISKFEDKGVLGMFK